MTPTTQWIEPSAKHPGPEPQLGDRVLKPHEFGGLHKAITFVATSGYGFPREPTASE